MAKYRKISVQIWNDEKFRRLTDAGKLMFLFVLTHPQLTGVGAMRGTFDGLASELGWKPEKFRAAASEATNLKMMLIDEQACFICLPNFLLHNQPESPNVCRSWKTIPELLPECKLRTWYFALVVKHMAAQGAAFHNAVPREFLEANATDAPPAPQTPPPPANAQTSFTAIPAPGRSPRFTPGDVENIYAAYPRRVGAAAAKVAISRALVRILNLPAPPSDPVAMLFDQTVLFAKSPAGNAGKFTPHPATWYNQERYLDDPKEWQDHRTANRPKTASAGDDVVRGMRAQNQHNDAMYDRMMNKETGAK